MGYDFEEVFARLIKNFPFSFPNKYPSSEINQLQFISRLDQLLESRCYLQNLNNYVIPFKKMAIDL